MDYEQVCSAEDLVENLLDRLIDLRHSLEWRSLERIDSDREKVVSSLTNLADALGYSLAKKEPD